MTTVAFDLGSTTGWAVQVYRELPTLDESSVVSGSMKLATDDEVNEQKRTGLERRLDIRFVNLYHFISELVHQYHPNQVVFEDVAFTSSQAQIQLWSRLSSAIWATAVLFEFEVQAVPVGTLKHFATGNGGADKELMRSALQSRYPHLLKPEADDNEVDAIWLLKFSQSVDEGSTSFTSVWERKRLAMKLKRDKAKARRLALTKKISSYRR